MRPGLANAFLLGFIESMADFGNPLVLGGNFNVLSTEIFFAVVGAAARPGAQAAVLADHPADVHDRRLLPAADAMWLGRTQLHHGHRQGRRRHASAAAAGLRWRRAVPPCWALLTVVVYLASCSAAAS
jgi:iron(III) transport system permease protein